MEELTPLDESAFLLQSAAEIEHALMVQYLYAAFTLELDASKLTCSNIPAKLPVRDRPSALNGLARAARRKAKAQ